MSYIKDSTIKATDSPSIDAFGRWRTSSTHTLFDSKQIFDSQDLYWNESETSGTGTATAHSTNEAATTISVSNTTAGVRVRQTFQRFNYQPGKSQLVLVTFSEFDTSTGLFKATGYYDDNNGLFFESDAGTYGVTRRTYISGSPADTTVVQANWNIDPLDGAGPSGITIDFTKAQIGIIDFEWLGVGRVRMGFVIDGNIYYCHQFLNANNLTTVYMSTPNLPIRYEIRNSGAGAADDFVHICSSVMSEGGIDDTGSIRHKDSGAISGLSTGVTYAILGIKLQSAKLGGGVKLENVSMLSSTVNDMARWNLVWNPTTTGGALETEFANEGSSLVQTVIGSSAASLTGGIKAGGGYFITDAPITANPENALRLGATIGGVRDQLFLTCTPITNNLTVYGSLTWRELS